MDINFLKSNKGKIILVLLFALALLLGLFGRKNLPDFSFGQGKTEIFFARTDKSLSDYYQEAHRLAEKKNPIKKVSFLAVGDIMLSRNVAEQMRKTQDPYLPYRGMEEILTSTDFNFGNLESPFSPTCREKSGGHSMIFAANCQSVEGLKNYNFAVLNLANNHALDQGLKGLLITRQTLNDAGIKTTGTGSTTAEAWQPAVVEKNGMKICFVGASYASINDSGKTRNDYVARIEDLDLLKTALVSMKPNCDFLMASMHAGTEYTHTPNKAQIAFARAVIDYGADMVIGSHPHWVQTVEKYNGKYIFYSLGNFIFDQEWSRQTKEGLTLKITLSSTGVANPLTPRAAGGSDLQGQRQSAKLESVELIPVIVENYSTPRPATEAEAKKILENIGEKDKFLY